MKSRFTVKSVEHVIDISEDDMYVNGEKMNSAIINVDDVRNLSWDVAKWSYIELAISVAILIAAILTDTTFSIGAAVIIIIYTLCNFGRDTDVMFDFSPDTYDSIVNEEDEIVENTEK